MTIRRGIVLASFTLALASATPAWTQGVLAALDPDKDGTVDLAEAKAAATKLFDKLDGDHDGTLDKKELRGRISGKDFTGADPDKDGTIDQKEYLAIVEQRFNAADPDKDSTLDAKELGSKAGKALLQLLQ
jgi:hypothetical protein